MSRVFKLFLLTLISLTSLNSFDLGSLSDSILNYSRTSKYTPSYFLSQNNPEFISVSPEFLNSGYVKIGNNIYIMDSKTNYEVFNTSFLKTSGYFYYYHFSFQNHYLLNYQDSFPKRSVSCIPDTINPHLKFSDCGEKNNNNPKAVKSDFSYYTYNRLLKVTTCQPDEHFNTQTKQCQKCPDGQKWDQKRNMCWKDCTNIDKNMYGFFDYSVSGRCIDCSNSKTAREILECFCSSSGHGVPPPAPHVDTGYPNSNPCVFDGKCQDGFGFPYTDPSCKKPKDPKPDDNNNTKPNQNDNNSTKPNDSGNSGNSGGGNSGNSGGDNNGQENNNNDDSGGGGPGGSEFCKKNPNHESCKENENDKFCKENPKDPKCKLSEFCKKNPKHKSCKPGKPGGDGNTTNNFFGGGGGGGNGNGDDEKAVFNEGDFKDGGADKEREGLYDSIKDHISNNFSKFDNISNGINQFIANVEGKGFDKVQGNIKKNCPFSIDMPLPNGSTKAINVDYCDVISPVSEVSYYAFYVGFAVGGFLLFLKLLMFAF